MPRICRRSSQLIDRGVPHDSSLTGGLLSRSILIQAALALCGAALAGQTAPKPSGSPPGDSGPIDYTLEAGESDAEVPVRKLISWNELDAKYFTIRGGGGFLVDYAAFAQNQASKDQMAVESKFQLRDARVLFKGKFKFLEKRKLTWSAGIMYNAPTHSWQFRQTGIMIEAPEIWGSIFVGRTKEGVSLNKVMVGYGGWTMERSTASDAMLPILADGIKWLGYAPKLNLIWNAGIYTDWLSKNLAFSKDKRLVAGRIAYVKLLTTEGGKMLHAGMNLRYGIPRNGEIQLRSRPEVYPSPYFLDTAKFSAENSKLIGPEFYYRNRSFLAGSEYYFMKFKSPGYGDPWFHGGEIFASTLLTGETRTYNIRGGYFNQISPKSSVFEGGRGAWEVVCRYSYTNLDSAIAKGGRFWRVTPMLNWHLSDHVRLEFVYGYGSLDRFELNGRTHFFQTRLQLQM